MKISEELDRQAQNLIQKQYHKIAGISESEFTENIQRLRLLFSKFTLGEADFEKGYLPFVIVVKNSLVSSEKMMEAVEYNSKPGITKLNPLKPEDFSNLKGLPVPEAEVYLLIDIDRGIETLNVTPENALDIISTKHRFPLTIDEGIAVMTQYPDFLVKNNCFSLLGSRTGRDQRVPAIWINGRKQANLGWCWDRNPHTWLGSASAKLRIG